MDDSTIKALIPLYAKMFIQRREPVAVQGHDGGYRPSRDPKTKEPYIRFDRETINNHLQHVQTYGHYLLDHNDMCKLFVLDVDLMKMGYVPTASLPKGATEAEYASWVASFVFTDDLRAVWHSRKKEQAPAREYIKFQLRIIANILASSVHKLTGLHTAAAYTGNKGIHVYGFTGPVPAREARDAAELVIESVDNLEPIKGDNFYADTRRAIPTLEKDANGELLPAPGYPAEFAASLDTFDPDVFHNFHVEVFPKQRSLEGKDLGNLVRLPLGRNLHSISSPTFFLDLTLPLDQFGPVDPVFALTCSNPWQTQAESGI